VVKEGKLETDEPEGDKPETGKPEEAQA
jgi:hypothetical protein